MVDRLKAAVLQPFLLGAATVLDIFGTSHRQHRAALTDAEAFARDAEALAGDWRVVSCDLNEARRLVDLELASSR